MSGPGEGDSLKQESEEGPDSTVAGCLQGTACLLVLHSGGLVLPRVPCQKEPHVGPERRWGNQRIHGDSRPGR